MSCGDRLALGAVASLQLERGSALALVLVSPRASILLLCGVADRVDYRLYGALDGSAAAAWLGIL